MKKECKVIAVVNEKGGVGKTTLSKSIAEAAEMLGIKTVVFDNDAQGSFSKAMGVSTPNDYKGLGHVLEFFIKRKQVSVLDYLVGSERLRFLVGNNDLKDIDVRLATAPEGIFYMADIVDQLRDLFELVIVDCNPSGGMLTKAALVAADFVVIPAEMEYLCVEGIRECLYTIADVQKRLKPGLKIQGIIPTKVDIRLNEHMGFIQQLYDSFDEEVRIYDYIPNSTVISSANKGANVFIEHPQHPAVEKLWNCCTQLIGEAK